MFVALLLVGAVGSGLSGGSSTPIEPDETTTFDPGQDSVAPTDAPPALPKVRTKRPKPKPAPNPNEGVVTITVTSTGSSGGSVTYVRPDKDSFQMSQDTSASLPWSKTFRNVQDLPMGWNMNAQQNGDGTLTCIVKKDGKVIAQNSSQGSYSVVTCQP